MIFLLLLAVNGLPLFLLKTSKKYWIISIPVWILLLTVLIVWRIRDDRVVNSSEKAYYATFGKKSFGTREAWDEMEKAGSTAAADSRKIFVGVGFQTLCVFVLMVTGHRRTKDRRYKWGSWFFGCCTVFVIFLDVLMTIIIGSPLA
jgi:uncharacterized membrane protein YeiB